MKKFSKRLLVLWVASTFMTAPSLTFADQIEVTVKGMVCSFCAQGIQKKLKAEEAVEKVSVSLESRKVSIATKQGKSLSDDVIRNLLTEAGYSVEKFERK